MAKLPTFQPQNIDGTRSAPVRYHALYYMAGPDYAPEFYRLALHKFQRNWVVSEPISGCRVCIVPGWFKGCPVSSGHMTLKEATGAAQTALDVLVAKKGWPEFDGIIRAAQGRSIAGSAA